MTLGINYRPTIKLKHFYIILFIISLVGLLFRISVSIELLKYYPPASNPSAQTDMFTYQTLAQDILDGDYDFSKGFYYQPFYYTVFLPLIYKISGSKNIALIIVQCILGTGVIWLTGISYAKIFGKLSGLTAALFIAFNRMHIFYSSFTLIAILQSFLISLFLYSILLAYNNKHFWLWGIVGIINGISIITRGNSLLFIPLVIILIYFSLKAKKRKMIICMLFYLLTVLIPQLPYSIINFKNEHQWVGASTAAGAVLALGNTPESPPGGREPESGAGPMEYPQSYYEWIRLSQLESNEKKSVLHNILDWFKSEPFAYIELKFRTFLLFWNQAEIPNNVSIDRIGKNGFKILNFPLLIDFIIIGSLGISGMIIALIKYKHKPKILFTCSIILVYCLATVAFYMLSRFRIPILPHLCGFSGFAFIYVIRNCRNSFKIKKQRRALLTCISVIIFSFIFVGWGADIYRYTLEQDIVKITRPNGVRIPLSDKVIYKDHGPMTFGGWITYPINSLKSIQKEFATGQSEKSIENCVIRFPVFSKISDKITLELQINNQKSQMNEVNLKQGFQWIEVKTSSDGNNILKLKMDFTHSDDDIFLFFDGQRFYGRTMIQGKSIKKDGEMVIELIIPNKNPIESLQTFQ